MHVIAGKAVALKIAQTELFRERQRRTRAGAAALAEELLGAGVNVLTGGTDVHLVLVDLRDSELDGQQAEDRLHEIGITVNRNAVPFDPRPPAVSSGLRIGTPALATRGFRSTTSARSARSSARRSPATSTDEASARAVGAHPRAGRALPALPAAGRRAPARRASERAALRARRRPPRAATGACSRTSTCASRRAPPPCSGPRASGKSTLLRLLNRLADPDEGSVRFDGEDVRDARRARAAPAGRASCRSCRRPLPGTVADNVALRAGAARRRREPDVERCLELAGLDASLRRPRRLAALGGRAAAA